MQRLQKQRKARSDRRVTINGPVVVPQSGVPLTEESRTAFSRSGLNSSFGAGGLRRSGLNRSFQPQQTPGSRANNSLLLPGTPNAQEQPKSGTLPRIRRISDR